MEKSLSEILSDFGGGITPEIQNAVISCYDRIHGKPGNHYKKILVSVSGGADSDVMLDLIERVGHPYSQVDYVFFDTGLEFSATKRHLDYLEVKYGISIRRERAEIPVAQGCRKFGVPFLNKNTSGYIQNLQRHSFDFSDGEFEELYKKYPRCKTALGWWCNARGDGSRFNISATPGLKKFMVSHPPTFRISSKCCDGAKKSAVSKIIKSGGYDLDVVGVRKSEGGVRSTSYKSCFSAGFGKADKYRPIFWIKNKDKEVYEEAFGVAHSECYTKYGLKRTGCACCPFGMNWEHELKAAKEFEPALAQAAANIFGDAYQYSLDFKNFRAVRPTSKKGAWL